MATDSVQPARGSQKRLLTPSDWSRRDFVKKGAAGAALLGLGPTVLAACGDDDEPAATTAAAAETTAAPAEPFRVGFAYISPRDDNGWSTTHDIGRLSLPERIPNVVAEDWVDNVPLSAEATQIFENLAQNNNMVVVCSEYADLLYPVADRHPDVTFLECDGHVYDIPNVRQYYIAHWDPAYVMGVAAGLLTESNRLGYVGAFPTATVFNDTNAFLLGARSVNPDVELQVVMVFSFFDPPGATQATNALIDGGADVIFDVQDDTTPLQICEERGVWSCIWNKDNREFGPNAFVNAIALDWNDYYVDQVSKAIDGTWTNRPDGPDQLAMGEGCDITPWGQNVPQEAQDAGDAAYAALKAGEFGVYDGPLFDNEGNERIAAGEALTVREMYDVDWSVEGVTGVL
ncbi:MAG: BMP family ABC transporter substrate-binding protein [Acidimicrobiia bacterium]|nr:BMP family ABC transporter substrate-binding protein [Acidimicrobiia bacterium]